MGSYAVLECIRRISFTKSWISRRGGRSSSSVKVGSLAGSFDDNFRHGDV